VYLSRMSICCERPACLSRSKFAGRPIPSVGSTRAKSSAASGNARRQRRAAAAQKLVADAARQSGARWSFQVVRQRTATAVLDLARQTDVTVFSTATFSHYRGQAMPEKTGPAARTAPVGESIVAVYDRTAAGDRAMQLAHRLAELRHLPVHAVVVADSPELLDRLTDQLQRAGGLDASHIHSLRGPKFGDIVLAMQAWRPAAAILPLALVEGSSERIHDLEKAIDQPILIVK